jgi:hypothetical protein
LWWLVRSNSTSPTEAAHSTPITTKEEPILPALAKSGVTPEENIEQLSKTQNDSLSSETGKARKLLDAQAGHRNELERQWNAQWNTPMSFYGKVIDEAQNPVAGASASFEWADIEGESRTSEAISDGGGLFSLTGVEGRSLNVRVSKEGYALTRSNQTAFLYADMTGRGTFIPDMETPVLFRLRRAGRGTELITSQYGVKAYLGVSAPLDGTPVLVDFVQRKTGEGMLKMSQVKPRYESWKQAAEWSFQMEISGGGFVETEDEFPFEAPEAGYNTKIAFNFRINEPNWSTDLSKNYYIRFGDPPRYGRLHLETSIMMSGARLTYAINPDGSRYLEPR